MILCNESIIAANCKLIFTSIASEKWTSCPCYAHIYKIKSYKGLPMITSLL